MPSTGEPSIFSRIAAREIPATIVAETDRVIAFNDIAPQAPVHVVITPKTSEYANVVELAAGDPDLLAELVAVASGLAATLSNGQFRLVFNTGETVGQTVFHVHAHLLAPQGAGGPLEEGTLGFR
ncbi:MULTISPECIES: HIT domain-containing protein [Cryobacterium]|uniref:HIT domain-containing protein n=1 Tax=Cryobacterium breve TaxID=1259258 RepID=A0ABY2IZY5_9MICO|nr:MULTISPECIES: HIT domain-containing protein [Cryobacterium]TFC96708.1 HIT domain-containing protein [Cryobacterium sp. TmT3-12]TFC97495.1 HIT domain-containing protein [Cryobacterium breve]